ncbi:Phage-related tail protein [uncultured Candidatus Thioglobus sp.]|nr:Phage-related tail protein [uncultured Candidatus Thioglobus sp.]
MKKIIYGLLTLVIIAVFAITFLFDGVAKDYAQDYVKNLLKTPVKISQLESSFLDKTLSIDFVEVQNPPSFNNKNALSLNHFSLEMGDISDDLIVINKVKFDGLEFVLEQNSTQVNLSTLIDNLDKISTKATESSDSSAQRIKIKRLEVNNISLKIDTDWLRTTLKVPNISVSHFGGNSGVEMDKIGKEVAQEILSNLKKALEKQGIEAGKKKIKETLMRKIGNKLGVENLQNKVNLDSVNEGLGSLKDTAKEKLKNAFDDKLKDKAQDLLKNFGF